MINLSLNNGSKLQFGAHFIIHAAIVIASYGKIFKILKTTHLTLEQRELCSFFLERLLKSSPFYGRAFLAVTLCRRCSDLLFLLCYSKYLMKTLASVSLFSWRNNVLILTLQRYCKMFAEDKNYMLPTMKHNNKRNTCGLLSSPKYL